MAIAESALPTPSDQSTPASNIGPKDVSTGLSKYKKIRWKKYDPKKRRLESRSNQFVLWTPPTGQTDGDGDDDPERKPSPCKGGCDKGKDNTASPWCHQAITMASPLQPLPLNGTRVDPFMYFPIKATDCVRDTMDYFITICSGFPEDSSVPGPVNPHLSLLLPYALKHPILFESMIAVCRASVLLSLDRPALEDAAFIQHRGNAIAGLNTKIRTNQCTDDDALLTATMLMTLEYLMGNHSAVQMHCEGLEKMLQLRGPLGQEGKETDWAKFVRHGLTGYKALGSFVTGRPPDIPPESIGYLKETFEELSLDKPLAYPEPPFDPDLCTILSRLPPGLSDVCLKCRISVQMIMMLGAVAGATTLLGTKSLLDGVSVPLSSSDDCLFDVRRQQSMVQALLSSLQRMSLTSVVPVELSLTSGLISYMFQLRSLTPLNLFYDPILRRFIATLPAQPKPTCVEEQHAFIWASMAVAGVLALRVAPMPSSHAVFDHVLDLFPEARDWRRLNKILCGFFWTNDIGAHWKTVWEAAMRRREFLLHRNKDPKSRPHMVTAEMPEHDFEGIRRHIEGAPRVMREMSEAMGICPFHRRGD
ncbi:uncharacterized protein PV06_06417 [Exophiala oligosperma]|uniref:Transcription factor domain-containing protein n=1 Tax=Exophiala oligosperma TaxID=215243 RepID=A0A0D2DKI6_9EURO|nr:uncharacterized protein PV06_06417 [Exophiala oligosperma]KIW42915.1 hypothetical protein PV06_06417 [Exophiala oligosperma]